MVKHHMFIGLQYYLALVFLKQFLYLHWPRLLLTLWALIEFLLYQQSYFPPSRCTNYTHIRRIQQPTLFYIFLPKKTKKHSKTELSLLWPYKFTSVPSKNFTVMPPSSPSVIFSNIWNIFLPLNSSLSIIASWLPSI